MKKIMSAIALVVPALLLATTPAFATERTRSNSRAESYSGGGGYVEGGGGSLLGSSFSAAGVSGGAFTATGARATSNQQGSEAVSGSVSGYSNQGWSTTTGPAAAGYSGDSGTDGGSSAKSRRKKN